MAPNYTQERWYFNARMYRTNSQTVRTTATRSQVTTGRAHELGGGRRRPPPRPLTRVRLSAEAIASDRGRTPIFPPSAI